MTVTPSPQSVVVPLEDWQHVIGALKNAKACLPMGAAIGNVSDALSKVEHLQAAPAPSSLAGGEVREKVAGVVECFAMDAGDVIGDPYGYAEAILAALSPEAPALNTIGCAELEVGRAVYERIEKLIDATTGPEAEELSYLAHLAASVEEVGGYDGPEAPAREAGES